MPDKVIPTDHLKGISQAEAAALQASEGKNIIYTGRTGNMRHVIASVVGEPMFILLIIAGVLYFVLGQPAEGYMTVTAIMLVTAISVYQELRSNRALEALKTFTQQKTLVVRDGREISIIPQDLVPGDIVILAEGNIVPADARVVQQNDLSVDESILTGESFPVKKSTQAGEDLLYHGTVVNSGRCYARITAIGNKTALGKIGKAVSAYTYTQTVLQQQIGRYVKRLALFGLSAFVLIWLANYVRSGGLAESLLFGLTLAMAAIPEEIPVAFSSFMALGAYHLGRLGIISRSPQVIENLGAVSVVCLDKTGTITENRMEVKSVFRFENGMLLLKEASTPAAAEVLGFATLASEQSPFDAMEKAILMAFAPVAENFPLTGLIQVDEYPLEGNPPMMTHIFREGAQRIAAAKGAAERILRVCGIADEAAANMRDLIRREAALGYRILGVASAVCPEGALPERQDDFAWKLAGIICLYDPPRKNAKAAISALHDAQIDVKLLTGDFMETAVTIARQVGIHITGNCLTGNDVMAQTQEELAAAVRHTSIFARMFPEAKEKVIRSLQANGAVVAMTGDGVNDAPALKAADIGIAMGQKGTEMARGAADLVITDDNLARIMEAVRQGRKIFINLKKSVRYIISIHIPIILTASVPVLLGWKYPNIFSPVHIIFLELIMGPTCSIFFEREPVEESAMKLPPRKRDAGIFTKEELITSLCLGLTITMGVLGLYYSGISTNMPLEKIRTLVFSTLLAANVLLTFTNRSFRDSLFTTLRYKNKLAPWVLISSLSFSAIILFVPMARELFGLLPLTFSDILLCVAVAFGTVIWFEGYKGYKRAYSPPSS